MLKSLTLLIKILATTMNERELIKLEILKFRC